VWDLRGQGAIFWLPLPMEVVRIIPSIPDTWKLSIYVWTACIWVQRLQWTVKYPFSICNIAFFWVKVEPIISPWGICKHFLTFSIICSAYITRHVWVRIKLVRNKSCKDHMRYNYGICEANLLDFDLGCFLEHGLNLKMELELGKLSLSAYKTAMKRRTQIVVIMMGWGSFTLGGFIVPEGIIETGVREA